MKLSNRAFGAICIALAVSALAAAFVVNRQHDDREQITKRSTPEIKDNQKALPSRKSHFGQTERVNIGGVARPLRDTQKSRRPVPNQRSIISNVGRTPRINTNANKAVESVVEALATKSHPERVSVMIEPKPFDRAEFERDPETYLNTVEPGRVFQAAASGPGVVPIRETGNQYFDILQGESIVLRARAEPNMPVTFYSAKLGQFENLLTSITVRADDAGNVETKFKATPGTRGDIDIIASSPVNSGFAKYIVKVNLPPEAVSADQQDN